MGELQPSTPSTVEDLIAWGRREGKKRLAILDDAPSPSGYVDLFVHQPNPLPRNDSAAEAERYRKDYFELPADNHPISSVEGLIIAAKRACRNGRKLRHLRIMGHGSEAHVRIGTDYVSRSMLIDINTRQKTPMAVELEKLKDYLEPGTSVVILDHCLAGQAEKLLILLSELWGNTSVRAFIDYQVWERGDVQFGQGMYRECIGPDCHLGVELVRVE